MPREESLIESSSQAPLIPWNSPQQHPDSSPFPAAQLELDSSSTSASICLGVESPYFVCRMEKNQGSCVCRGNVRNLCFCSSVTNPCLSTGFGTIVDVHHRHGQKPSPTTHPPKSFLPLPSLCFALLSIPFPGTHDTLTSDIADGMKEDEGRRGEDGTVAVVVVR